MDKASVMVEGTFLPGYESHYPRYTSLFRRFIERHKGRVVRRQRVNKALYGVNDCAGRPDLIMLIDFQSKDIAESVFVEPTYKELAQLRDKVFASFAMYLLEPGQQ